MNFCSNCGAPATGTAYCGNCGQPIPARTPTSTSPGAPGGAPQGAPATPSAAPSAVANPFSDIPVVDYARDAIALILLLVSFGMPWDLTDSSTGKVYVILAALLSVASLTLPYLKRGGILPATWGTAQLRLARLGANAPYVVVVLVTLVLAYIGDAPGDGVGVGMAFGLAGALLAAQGRRTEQDPEPGDGAIWRAVTVGVAALFALLVLLSLALFLVDFPSDLGWAPITLQILIGVFFLAVVALPVAGFARGQSGWREVLVLLAAVGLFVGLWQLAAEGTLADAWSLRTGTPGVLLYPAIGAAASAAGIAVRARETIGALRWVTLSVRLFQLVVLVAAFGAAIYLVQLIEIDDGRGSAITVLVLHLLVVVAALVGRNALVSNPAQGRAVAIGAGLVFAVLGIVIVSVLGASDLAIVGLYDATMASIMWWFAIAILLALTTPKAVRDEYGPVSMSMAGAAADTAAQTSETPRATSAKPAPVEKIATAEAPEKPVSADKPATTAGKPDESAKPAAEPAKPAGEAVKPAAEPEKPAVEPEKPAVEPEKAAAAPLKPAAEPEKAAQAPKDDPRAAPAVDQTAVLPTTDAEMPSKGGDVVREAGFDSRTAVDPDTPLQTLADIAAQAPSLRPYVATNPSTYPELLEWLSQLGDPAVDEALRRRS